MRPINTTDGRFHGESSPGAGDATPFTPGWCNDVQDSVIKLEKGSATVTGIRLEAGAATTLLKSDAGGIVEMTSADANIVTVPAATGDTAVDFPDRSVITVICGGAGVTTIAADAGVAIKGRGLVTNGQNSAVQLIHYGNNIWRVFGDLAEAA